MRKNATRTMAVLATVAIGVALGSSAGASNGSSSPLREYVGLGHNAADERSIFAAEESVRQKAIQSCMAERGFAYTPVPADMNILAPTPGSVAYFGMVEPHDPAKSHDAVDLQDNPNVEFADSLPVRDRTQYYEALFGADWESPNQPAALYEESCTGSAYAQTPGLGAEVAELRNAYKRTREDALKSDDRIRVATQNWTSCMADEGFTVTSWEDMLRQVDQAVDSRLDTDGTLSNAAYQDLFGFEGDLYAANQACGHDLRSTVEQVLLDVDARFLNSHRAELEEFHIDRY